MAEEEFTEGNPSDVQQELYIPVRTLGRGAFGEAVLYRKKEVWLIFIFFLPLPLAVSTNQVLLPQETLL